MSSEPYRGRKAAVSSEEFRRACGRFATGVSIASVVDCTGTPHGLTVSSFASVSLEPPLILICLGHAVTNIEDFRRARHFGINVLREDQRLISERFAQKGYDRFDGIGWLAGETGVPLITTALATMECATHQRFAAGDHDIFIGEVVHTSIRDGSPLIHYASRYRKLASE
jgi:flavin reductase (DIM6/NTAB) family NADH-FMN oxidoreductase RutF